MQILSHSCFEGVSRIHIRSATVRRYAVPCSALFAVTLAPYLDARRHQDCPLLIEHDAVPVTADRAAAVIFSAAPIQHESEQIGIELDAPPRV